ncbi:MAG TPA: hypothetical protein VNI84_00710, partial [Pyrinomonadaceae bacterium]|nr:hypothetical protein [Pyrinomonadaceae bacterium]
HVGKNLAISLQEFITLSFLYRKRTIKRILFAFIFQTSALPVQSRLVKSYDEIISMLVAMISKSHLWVLPSGQKETGK